MNKRAITCNIKNRDQSDISKFVNRVNLLKPWILMQSALPYFSYYRIVSDELIIQIAKI
jgi:hypothetical protein